MNLTSWWKYCKYNRLPSVLADMAMLAKTGKDLLIDQLLCAKQIPDCTCCDALQQRQSRLAESACQGLAGGDPVCIGI